MPSTQPSRKTSNLTVDYRSSKPMPEWVRDVIDTHLAIEAEDAKSAGELGFMARALVLATMPYKDPKSDVFKRRNGDFSLRIVAGYEGGIPYGIYPRLLTSWVTTEAVRTKSPVIELGDSLRHFLRDVLDVRSSSGGVRGSGTRASEQMKRLFGSLITAQYEGTAGPANKRGFVLRNVLIAEALSLDEEEMKSLDGEASKGDGKHAPGSLWLPQTTDEAGKWQSQVRLSDNFFKECVSNPVPIDLRAYKTLRRQPLAMDVYTWLTYRMSYTHRRTRPIRWEALMGQFGTGFNTADMGQAVRDFRKAFLRALKLVLAVYPQASVELNENGLVLLPSRPHIPMSNPGSHQPGLF